MSAVWPATLPQDPLRRGLQEQLPDLLIRTPMDAGEAKVRRRFTAGTSPLQLAVKLTVAQRATLATFYVTTLDHGAERFEWKHPITQATVEFRFTAPPIITPAEGNAWQASMQLEVMP